MKVHKWNMVPDVQPRTLRIGMALAASLCWTGALMLLFLANLRSELHVLAPQRLLFYMLVLAAGWLTFVPIQKRMRLPHLALEGVGGTAVLLYTLAFVPPPTASLLWLPDLPVYLLFIAGLFWSVSALVLPIIYAIGQRLFRQRLRQMDFRRASRQAHEVGALVAATAALAGVRVLTWVSLLLLTLIVITAEILFLSRVEVADT